MPLSLELLPLHLRLRIHERDRAVDRPRDDARRGAGIVLDDRLDDGLQVERRSGSRHASHAARKSATLWGWHLRTSGWPRWSYGGWAWGCTGADWRCRRAAASHGDRW